MTAAGKVFFSGALAGSAAVLIIWGIALSYHAAFGRYRKDGGINRGGVIGGIVMIVFGAALGAWLIAGRAH